MRHRLIAAGLTALLAVSPVAAVPALAAPLPSALTCTGVWVVVDFGGGGGTQAGCATSYGTGTQALKSAFRRVSIDGGFVSKIDGKPSNPDPNKAYWSYWHAGRTADGGHSGWSYSSVGSDEYHPKKGDAEGWRYQSLSEGNAAPRASAPSASAAEPEPTATPTKASATAKATTKATAKASASPTASAKATPSASTPAEKGTVPFSAAPTESATAGTEVTAVAAEAPSAEISPTETGNPTGTIVAAAIALIAAGGLGGWWLLKGRRR